MAGSKNEACECAIPIIGSDGKIKCGPSYCKEKICMPNGSCCEIGKYCESSANGKECCTASQTCDVSEGCVETNVCSSAEDADPCVTETGDTGICWRNKCIKNPCSSGTVFARELWDGIEGSTDKKLTTYACCTGTVSDISNQDYNCCTECGDGEPGIKLKNCKMNSCSTGWGTIVFDEVLGWGGRRKILFWNFVRFITQEKIILLR